MIRQFTNKDLHQIAEAYRLICEDAEGKNINRAEKFIKTQHPEIIGLRLQNGSEMNPRVFTQEIRNLMPNVRLANCKFLLGVSRLYFDDLTKDQNQFQQKSSQLNKILKIIASDAHVNEYDHNLNGKSFDELNAQFASAAQKNLDDDRNNVAKGNYQKNNAYDIVRIDSFEQAQPYGKYTSWCVTHYPNMFSNYTSDGLGVFYFCLRKGYESEPRQIGENAPLDEYGKSMIAISVNDDGSLNTCTCRWNHDNGGNDSLMDTQQISNFFGVNFYETFKPKTVEELMERYSKIAVENPFAKKMGWLYVRDEDGGYGQYCYIIPSNGRILKYRHAGQCDGKICLASDHFYWYDEQSGKQIPPPSEISNGIACPRWSQLTSLRGLPKRIGDDLDLNECENLKSLDYLPDFVGGNVRIEGCENIDRSEWKKLANHPMLLEDIIFNDCETDSFKVDESGNVTFLIDIDQIKDIYGKYRDELSWDFIKSAFNGDPLFDYFETDNFNINNDFDDDMFDKIMSEEGIDLDADDIKKVYNDDNDVIESGRLSEEQYDVIKDIMENDFYEGNGIAACYGDALQSGMENEAYNAIKDTIFSELPLDSDYGVQDGTVKVILSKDAISQMLSEYIPEDFDGFFKLYRTNDGEVENISVSEPYYGFSELNKEMWDEAIAGFAHRIAKYMKQPPLQRDSEGQLHFDFDKEYIDNPFNLPRE